MYLYYDYITLIIIINFIIIIIIVITFIIIYCFILVGRIAIRNTYYYLGLMRFLVPAHDT